MPTYDRSRWLLAPSSMGRLPPFRLCVIKIGFQIDLPYQADSPRLDGQAGREGTIEMILGFEPGHSIRLGLTLTPTVSAEISDGLEQQQNLTAPAVAAKEVMSHVIDLVSVRFGVIHSKLLTM
jgi:hypothetical protein